MYEMLLILYNSLLFYSASSEDFLETICSHNPLGAVIKHIIFHISKWYIYLNAFSI